MDTMDEEYHFDERSPIGKIITHVNKLCKKPQLDEELQKALERFHSHLNSQRQYMENGIFSINFAEVALFLQSCATLYCKKVDLLWDELLVLHTRFIEYDCEHEKQKGKKLDEDAIKKLEERRNRYKRKKKFKLTLQEEQQGLCLFDKPLEEIKQYDADENITQIWKRFEIAGNQYKNVPNAVYKQQSKMYRLKNYRLLKCEDFDVMDLDDDEFNTKYSRIPGWHHLHHLFEYNDNGLLPDKNNLIATLRLSLYGRLRFLDENKIPLNTPFKEYQKEYMVYRQQFFAKEAKKWQNMPLDTMADLHRQLLYLARVERSSSNAKVKACQSPYPKVFADIVHCCDDSKSSISSSPCSVDRSIMRSGLFVRLEKMSSDAVNTKLRQDSGYFEFNDLEDHHFDDTLETTQVEGTTGDKEKVPDQQIEGGTVEAEEVTEEARNEGITWIGASNETSKDTEAEAIGEQHDQQMEESPVDNAQEQIIDTVAPPNTEPSTQLQGEQEDTPLPNDDEDDDTMSIAGEHDYCMNAPHTILSELNKNKDQERIAKKMPPPPPPPPVFGGSRVIPKPIQLKLKRGRPPSKETEEPVVKRRKLPQKTIEKLKKSLVAPVKLSKFEKFFARNYQPQMGEGEVHEMSSDSESEHSEDDLPASPEPEDLQDADTMSVMSEHSYCSPSKQTNVLHDSGIYETEPSHLAEPSREDQMAIEEEARVAERIRSENRRIEREPSPVDPMEAQIEEALREFRESRRGEDEYFSRIQMPSRHETEAELAESRRRVEEWRSHITPLLKSLKENEFDIHGYGSAIMEKIEVGESRPFKTLVEGKSASEVEVMKDTDKCHTTSSTIPTNESSTSSDVSTIDVSSSERLRAMVVRFFTSSLQLANTGNIEICGARKGSLSNDSFEVKLLTKDRYHEHLTEYHAPSQGMLKEKLKRMRQSRTEEDQVDEPHQKQSCQSKSRGKTPLRSLPFIQKSSRKLSAPLLTPTDSQHSLISQYSLEYLQPSTSTPSNGSQQISDSITLSPVTPSQNGVAATSYRDSGYVDDLATPSTSRGCISSSSEHYSESSRMAKSKAKLRLFK